MEILLLGRTGQLGWELRRCLAPLGRIHAPGPHEVDLEDLDGLRARLRARPFDVLVNAAAYTAVDDAEREPERAFRVNAHAVEVLAREAQRRGALLVHFSTDYVFDGTKGAPYTEDDEPRPRNVYGRSKLAGEEAIAAVAPPHLVFRTSWLYAARGKNFLRAILARARAGQPLRVVADQVGAPTWARHVAAATAQILAQTLRPGRRTWEVPSGVYHLSARGEVSWFDFARAILERLPPESRVPLEPTTTEAWGAPADRPRYSALDGGRVERVFGLRLPAWAEGLDAVAEELELGAGNSA